MRIRLFDYIKVIMKTLIIVTHVPLITIAMRQEFQFPLWIDQAVPFFWIISAFLFNLAFHRHKSQSPIDELRKQRLFPRLDRILFPYCVIFILMLFFTLWKSDIYTAASILIGLEIPASAIMFVPALLIDFICGGNGPGGYYIPMLFQMYLLLPFLCYWYKKKPAMTILLFSLAIAIWELAAAANIVSSEVYRLILLREGFYLLSGIAISEWYIRKTLATQKHLMMAIAMTLVGALYLLAISNWGLPPLSGTAWESTSTLSFAYVAGVMVLLLALSYKAGKLDLIGLGDTSTPNTKIQGFFETVSKAALHIYIFQMFYYYVMPLELFSMIGLKASIVASILICSSCGFIHYKVENYVRKKWLILKEKKARGKQPPVII